ncbi:phospholipase A2 inhibitor NAI-like [Anomaloglossus baeobatrachus]|uniref:phospholipase A2 inhibitor NAI-like n=1 Tax=Anomaloglossus baeobatrachus TaxID=238106 RepID=UPI003F5026E6
MKNLVALLCLISALVASVFSYKCHSCLSLNSTKCNTSEMECLGDRCMTVIQYLCINGHIYKSIYKACANETLCNAKGSARVQNFRFRFYAKCCTGELCNTDGYRLPAEDPNPNGVKCPSAYCTGILEDCKTDKKINCTGSMNQCYEFRGDAIDPGGTEMEYSVHGCMNSDACKFNFDCTIGVTEPKNKYLKCYTKHNQGNSSE